MIQNQVYKWKGPTQVIANCNLWKDRDTPPLSGKRCRSADVVVREQQTHGLSKREERER